VFVCACVLLICGAGALGRWPLLTQLGFIVLCLVLFPLLNGLGVLRALRINQLPGAQFRSRYMYGGAALFAGSLLWVAILVRLVPDSTLGAWLLLGPSMAMFGGSVYLFVKGTQ